MSDKKHGVTGASCHERIFQKKLKCLADCPAREASHTCHFPLAGTVFPSFFHFLRGLKREIVFNHFVLSVQTDGDFMMVFVKN